MDLKKILLISYLLITISVPSLCFGQENAPIEKGMFDDTQLLNGYSEKYRGESKDIILAMLEDDTLNPYQMSAAVRVFKEKYSQIVVSQEKLKVERDLIHLINKTNAPFLEAEIMHTLCLMDRYKYFDSMVPALILKLDHYNRTVNEIAYKAINNIIDTGKNSKREARIVFRTLRNVLFLSRNTLKKITTPDDRLSQKLNLLRWSIKILGSQELKRLPKEVIHLL